MDLSPKSVSIQTRVLMIQQECIQVECVQSATVAVGWMSVPVHAGIFLPGGVCPSAYWDMSAQGSVCPSACWDMSAQGGVCPSACWDTPLPCEQNRQTGVKTLPCCNYIADDNERVSLAENCFVIM